MGERTAAEGGQVRGRCRRQLPTPKPHEGDLPAILSPSYLTADETAQPASLICPTEVGAALSRRDREPYISLSGENIERWRTSAVWTPAQEKAAHRFPNDPTRSTGRLTSARRVRTLRLLLKTVFAENG